MIPIGTDDQAALGDDRDKLLERAMARHHYSGDALIEVLHTAQELCGYLSRPLLKTIARGLKLPPSRVLGVATFYHLFRFTPSKTHSAVVCMGTACYVAGGTELMSSLRECCGANPTGWTIEAGRCLGSCGLAPVVIFDGAALSRVTPAQLETRLREMHDGGNLKTDITG
jgi:bidirectional [NiFe] hydrogenase diaphorase subunit